MDFSNFTVKAQNAVQKSVQIASANNHQALEPIHILMGAMETDENITRYLFNKCGMGNISDVAASILQKLPKVTGGEPYMSSKASAVMQSALELSRTNGDQFVSIEFLLLALLKNTKRRIDHAQRCRSYRSRLHTSYCRAAQRCQGEQPQCRGLVRRAQPLCRQPQ